MSTPTPPGLVVVDKPAGMTSHDVVARVRRLAGTRKVGHAGTLDPMATGVLLLGVNRATRLLGHPFRNQPPVSSTSSEPSWSSITSVRCASGSSSGTHKPLSQTMTAPAP